MNSDSANSRLYRLSLDFHPTGGFTPFNPRLFLNASCQTPILPFLPGRGYGATTYRVASLCDPHPGTPSLRSVIPGYRPLAQMGLYTPCARVIPKLYKIIKKGANYPPIWLKYINYWATMKWEGGDGERGRFQLFTIFPCLAGKIVKR